MDQGSYLDISVPLKESTVVWPDDPGFKRQQYASFTKGSAYQASELHMGSHSGTHIDAPAHFLPGGSTIDTIPIDVLIGKARVVEINSNGAITREDLQPLNVDGTQRLLLKTPNSNLYKAGKFESDFSYLSLDAADYLIELGIQLVGIDYLSIAEFHNGTAVHSRLLENGIVILETIDLTDVEPGAYGLVCLPLLIAGGDGAPTRAVLKRLKSG